MHSETAPRASADPGRRQLGRRSRHARMGAGRWGPESCPIDRSRRRGPRISVHQHGCDVRLDRTDHRCRRASRLDDREHRPARVRQPICGSVKRLRNQFAHIHCRGTRVRFQPESCRWKAGMSETPAKPTNQSRQNDSRNTDTQRAPPSRDLFPLLPVDSIGDQLDTKPFWRRPPRLVGETCTSTLGATPNRDRRVRAVGALLVGADLC
jgi:hypothetical protein